MILFATGLGLIDRAEAEAVLDVRRGKRWRLEYTTHPKIKHDEPRQRRISHTHYRQSYHQPSELLCQCLDCDVLKKKRKKSLWIKWFIDDSLLLQCPRHLPVTAAFLTSSQGTMTFASTVIQGHATDMNVHPAFSYLTRHLSPGLSLIV